VIGTPLFDRRDSSVGFPSHPPSHICSLEPIFFPFEGGLDFLRPFFVMFPFLQSDSFGSLSQAHSPDVPSESAMAPFSFLVGCLRVMVPKYLLSSFFLHSGCPRIFLAKCPVFRFTSFVPGEFTGPLCPFCVICKRVRFGPLLPFPLLFLPDEHACAFRRSPAFPVPELSTLPLFHSFRLRLPNLPGTC